MKKKTLFLIIAIAVLLICGIGIWCSNTKERKTITPDNPTLVFENAVNLDKEYVYLNHSQKYIYYETTAVLKDYLDDEACDGTIESVGSVLQFEDSKGPKVVLTTHRVDLNQYDIRDGFYVMNQPLNDITLNLTFEQAFEKMMKANYVKPHSRYCVLRKQVGPKVANPQYIFGNDKQDIFVDAITGDVTDKNPAFDE